MRIVIDIQGFQSPAGAVRGIGRYSMSLAKGIIRNAGEHEIIVLLNDMFPETLKSIRRDLKGILPDNQIRVWTSPGPVGELTGENSILRKSAILIRETYIASLQPDMVLVTSLFEGAVDDAVTSVGQVIPLPTAVVLYDLIPLIYRDIYLTDPGVTAWYDNKIADLRRADLLLSISDSSGEEAVRLLGFERKKVKPISTASEAHFFPHKLSQNALNLVSEKFGVDRPFLMYTGGADQRKNVPALVRAFAALPQKLISTHQLVLVCAIDGDQKRGLEKLAFEVGLSAGDFIITGFVTEEDLVLLYNACKLFVFPSWHEGFGLPVLEAMKCGRAVIAGNTSSLPEVVGRLDTLFDPQNDAEITQSIQRVLTDSTFRTELEHYSLKRAELFDWDVTARRALEAMAESVAQISDHHKTRMEKPERNTKLRLAFVSSKLHLDTQEGKFVKSLVHELSAFYDVDVIAGGPKTKDQWIEENSTLHNLERLKKNRNCYDRILYQFGGLGNEGQFFDLLQTIPGVVDLQDLFISGFDRSRDEANWTNSILTTYGYASLKDFLKSPTIKEGDIELPASLPIFQAAHGIIFHGKPFIRMAAWFYGVDVLKHSTQIDLPDAVNAPDFKQRREARERLGFDKGTTIVCCLQDHTKPTRDLELLNAFSASKLCSKRDSRLIFFGGSRSPIDLKALEDQIEISGLADRGSISLASDLCSLRDHILSADMTVHVNDLDTPRSSTEKFSCIGNGFQPVVKEETGLDSNNTEGALPKSASERKKALVEEFNFFYDHGDPPLSLAVRTEAKEQTKNSVKDTAGLYFDAIESFYSRSKLSGSLLPKKLAALPENASRDFRLSEAIAQNFPPKFRRSQLFVDVGCLVRRSIEPNFVTKIESALIKSLLSNPKGWLVEPVYFDSELQAFRYARGYTLNLLGIDTQSTQDDPINAWQGDRLVGIDNSVNSSATDAAVISRWQDFGVEVSSVSLEKAISDQNVFFGFQ